ncbi:beta-ketoacyl-ACP synthase II [Nocardia sp. CDC159]|uniref:Beta-ketoacyl-ACP synthase II n=1 Tax=Nocardia pulmonis TaxID=2951408 RepID=A0A9X2IX67_9NOCA|nr:MULTISPECIES: beta-ketoacyl-ACP synthase II [Nocardia]MCM6774309.1 beta-ketoacyl-ACP synthase II [Nocardia pulmonis]MCM6787625.1 beta-ketoacyl-ACP synthase II [Nocardia sp. CDC159]
MNDIVITGIGAMTPVGNDRETTWRNLLHGNSGIGAITLFDPEAGATGFAGEVKGYDPAQLFDAKRAVRASRFVGFAVAAAREAVRDAGLEVTAANSDRIGVVLNSAVAGFDTIEGATRRLLTEGAVEPRSYFVPYSLANMPACEVAIDLGIHGPVTSSVLACASGLYALIEARRLILSGEADVVVCGGADAPVTPVLMSGLAAMGALSRRNDKPQHASRPFSADRDGMVLGEGAVVLVLESRAHAARRAALPYATFAGGSLTCDGFHVSAPAPEGTYAAAAMTRALAAAEVTAAEVDYLCAHGTSTPANDRIETAAVKRALGEHARTVPMSSPKSTTGHLFAAAGALNAMVCALSIRDGIVPPTINLDVADPDCDLDYVPGLAREITVETAVANAFGFGGQNCAAVFTAAHRAR